MILFEKIRWKNFLSTGNKFTEVQLNRSPTTLIIGKNGAGKSTMLDALSFGLFGKPHRSINKAQMINTINNKDCRVEVEFKVGKHEFKLVRSIKPNTLEIWQNGKMINQNAEVKDYQKYLEQNILKLNHKSFHQIVVLGSSSFIPFMQLPGGARRSVIEDLLDINIFTKMNVILRERMSVIKDKLKDIEYDIGIAKERILIQRKYVQNITDINDEQVRQKRDKIEHLSQSILALQDKNGQLSEFIQSNQEEAEENLRKTQNKHHKMVEYNGQFKQKMRVIAEEAQFFEDNDNCPTCDQSIEEEFREKRLVEAKSKAKELSEVMGKAKVELDDLSDEMVELKKHNEAIRDAQSEINTNNLEIGKVQKEISSIETEIEKLSAITGDLSTAKAQLEKLLEERDVLTELKLKTIDERNYGEVSQEMLKDTGIKTKIIKEYLPVMNKLINSYLQTMDFFVSFHLDESFSETIRSRHRDNFNYNSFSEGEKMRIDLALLFTWRQIAKMKNSASTNLLIMDETFDASLDHDGIDNLLKIMKTLGDDTNTFVVSHKGDALDGKFRSTIEFEKVKNFSVMKVS